MIILDLEQNTPEWLEARKGVIKGSNVYNVLATNTATKEELIAILDEYGVDYPKTKNDTPKGTKSDFEALLTTEMEAELMRRANKKVEFYQLIADKIAIDTKDEYDENGEIVQSLENMMDRGHRLEDIAADIFQERTGKNIVKAGFCIREDNAGIGNSPDRLIDNDGKYTEALEIKCIKTARHLQALIEQRIPPEYYSQAIQYFVVNDDLQKLYFAFYDPRIPYDCKFHWIEIVRDDKVQRMVDRYIKYETVLLDEVNKWVEKLAF